MEIPVLIPVGLAIIGIFIVFSIFLQRGTRSAASDMGGSTKVCLVLLRLAIGWQMLVEGCDKINDATWTSENYLRASQGPAAPFFKNIAGDTLRDRITVGANNTFPSALDAEWRSYLDAFQRHYNLDPVKSAPKRTPPEEKKEKKELDLKMPVTRVDEAKEVAVDKIPDPKKVEEEKPVAKKEAKKDEGPTPSQLEHSEVVLKQQKLQTLRWLNEEPVIVEKKPPRGDATPIQKKVKDWLKELEALDKTIASAEATRQWRAAGDDPQAWERQVRAGLKRALEQQTATLKVALKDLLTQDQELLGAVPPSVSYSGNWLRWSDLLVKWGLAIGGACLIAGFLTRPAALLGALLLLSFYAAMPALPWLPENPRAEGHYLFINKTLIEAIALLTIATTRSGRWFGIDGLLQFIFPSRWHASSRK